MAQNKIRFNKTGLLALVRKETKTIITDKEINCLKFRVGGRRSVFFFEKRISGRKGSPIKITIGAFPAISIEEARQKARGYANECERGIDPRTRTAENEEAPKLLFRVAVKKFFDEKKEIGKRSLEDYRAIVRCYVPSSWMKKDIRDITAEMLVRQFHQVRKTAKKRCWEFLKVFNNIWNTCAPFFKDENNERLLRVNPIPEVRTMLKNVPRNRPNRLVIPVEHLGKFVVTLERLRKAESPSTKLGDVSISWAIARMCDICLLSLFTGFRFAEAQHLKWEYVDLEHGIIRLPGNAKHEKGDFDGTKNHHDHWVPLSSYAWDLLREFHSNRKSSSPYVFAAKRVVSRPIGRNERAFPFISQTVGFHYSPHASRRTFASVADEVGLGFLAVKRMLNHSYVGGVTGGYIVPGFNPSKERGNFQKVCDYILDRRVEYLGIRSKDSGSVDMEEAVLKLRRYAVELGVDLGELLCGIKVS